MRSFLALYLVPFLAPPDRSGGGGDLPPELATSLGHHDPTPEPVTDATSADLTPADPTPPADATRADASTDAPADAPADARTDAFEDRGGRGVDGGSPGDALDSDEGARALFEDEPIHHEVTVDTMVLVTVDGVEHEPIKLSVGVAVDVPADLVGPLFDFLSGARAGLRASVRGF